MTTEPFIAHTDIKVGDHLRYAPRYAVGIRAWDWTKVTVAAVEQTPDGARVNDQIVLSSNRLHIYVERPAGTTVSVGTRSNGSTYTGVIKAGRHILVDCGHEHDNRDMTGVRGRSARDCIALLVKAATNTATADGLVHAAETAWQRLTGGFYFVPAATVAVAKAAAPADATAVRERIAEITDIVLTYGL